MNKKIKPQNVMYQEQQHIKLNINLTMNCIQEQEQVQERVLWT